MKNLKKLLSICLALMMVLTCVPAAFAAEVDDCTIDEDAKASLTIWKFDWTNAYKDGVWDEDSFISTGWRESYVEEVLGETVREGDANGNPDHPLGNGQNSNGYALKGVEFTILRVADIVTFTESANDQHPDYNLTQVLYAFDKDKAADLLTAIGLGDGAGRYENADVLNYETSAPLAPVDAEAGVDAQAIAQVRNCWYYQSDVLNKALADALEANATTVKDALEAYVAASDEAIVMDKTNENGKTIKRDLDLGLWLCIETKVPEMVTSTTNPFFISLPMTTVSGDANSASPEGGHFWNYDVVVYPKNNTGIPELTKEVRESVKDTGTNGGTDDINDGFAHAATGSAGDVMEFQILAGLPTITSNATSIKTWQFYDSIDQGLTYNKALKDVKIEIFSNEDCTDKVATWLQDDGKFTVTYSSDDRHMTIDITEAGLDEINGNQENVNGKLFASYSNYTMRVTYTATINSNASFIYGEDGNCNEVVLTWKRTSSEYYDTLIDDCHVFSFGIDLTKLFSDLDSESATEMDMFKHVKFKLWNETDGYWLTATRDEETGIYYVTGHVTEEADATIFYPVTVGGEFGKVVIKGMENDCWNIYEVETANGYTLLKDEIYVDIFVEENYDRICDIYTKDVLGVLQNDPHYCFGNAQPMSMTDADGGFDLHLTGIPQEYMEHYFLTAYATVDNNDVNMEDDGESENALAPLTIVNTKGFDLPQTGDNGTRIFTVVGVIAMAGAMFVLFLVTRKGKKKTVANKKKATK